MNETPEQVAATPPAAPLLDRVETVTLALTAVGMGLGFVLGGSGKAFAIAIGGLFAVLNFRGLRILIKAFVSGREAQTKLSRRQKATLTVLALAKFVVFYGGVWVLLTRTAIDRIGFTLGFSTFVLALAAQGLRSPITPEGAPAGGPSHG